MGKCADQGTETLLGYARRKPEVQLSRLTRLIDPLLKLRQENMCESSQLNCTLASKDLYRVCIPSPPPSLSVSVVDEHFDSYVQLFD
jgi:hypothetical protein